LVLPDIVDGDAAQIRHVLLTLVGNAVKFTGAGSVTLRVAPDGMEPATAGIRFEVVDTGVGLPEEHRTRIFERFTQVDQMDTREFGGTGLGLAVAKLRCSAMGGEIGVDSEPGGGSRFWFTLPLVTPMADDAG
jgi:signal transduction histidine kinase